jgi:hypothetical protein
LSAVLSKPGMSNSGLLAEKLESARDNRGLAREMRAA